MTTALGIITGAARLIGAVRKSEALDGDEAADGLVALNDMLSSWSTSSLVVYSRVRESFTLTATASFLIGSGQTFNTVKPVKIVSAFIRSGSVDYPLTTISDTEYDNISMKDIAGGVPEYLSYNNAHPYGTIRLYPIPTGGDELHLLSEKVITNFASLATTVDLPEGWNEALRYNLALRLCPEYGMKADPVVVDFARKSLGAIKRAVSRNRKLPYIPGDVERNNIYTGYTS